MSLFSPKLFIISLLLFCVFWPNQVVAVAYCALRDPVTTIYQLFPEADSYRSDVRTVGKATRRAVRQELPFDLHFNELGRHTLYVAQQSGAGLGFVHARSEQGRWGLNEYVWAISPNLRILNVRIQRSRDPKLRDPIFAHTLTEPMLEKDLGELIEDYNEAFSSVNTNVSKAVEVKSELVHANRVDLPHDPGFAKGSNASYRLEILRSAIKTLFVTEQVWAQELYADSALKTAKLVNAESKSVRVIDDLFNEKVRHRLDSLGMSESPMLEREDVVGFEVFNNEGVLVGFVFRTPFTIQDPLYPLWWVTSSSGKITHVDSRGGASDEFAYLLDFSPKHPRDCSSAMDLAALEVSLLASFQ